MGRVARAITDMALAQDEKCDMHLYSLSTQISKEREKYYQILESTQKGKGEITDFLVWFLNMFINSVESSETLIEKALLIGKFYAQFEVVNLNERQKKVIRKMLETYPEEFSGGMTNKKYVSITNVSPEDLVEKKILLKNKSAGRSTSYRLNQELIL